MQTTLKIQVSDEIKVRDNFDSAKTTHYSGFESPYFPKAVKITFTIGVECMGRRMSARAPGVGYILLEKQSRL